MVRAATGLGEGGCAIAGRLLRILGIPCATRRLAGDSVTQFPPFPPPPSIRIRVLVLVLRRISLDIQYSLTYSTWIDNNQYGISSSLPPSARPSSISLHQSSLVFAPRYRHPSVFRYRHALYPRGERHCRRGRRRNHRRRVDSRRLESSDGGGIRRRAASRRRRPFTLALARRRYASRPSRHLCQLFHPTRGSCLVSSRRNRFSA